MMNEGGVGAYFDPLRSQAREKALGTSLGLLETEKPPAKNRQKPKNRKKSRPKPKTEIKPLTDKALVGFRISLSVI